MKYKLVLFDMDGTFVDSKAFHAHLFYEFFTKYWQPVSYENCYHAVGSTVRGLFEECGLPEELQESYFILLDEYYNGEGMKLLHKTKLADGFKELLEWMKHHGLPCGVVTNSLNCVVEKILKYHGIWDCFVQVVGADKDSKDKVERCHYVLEQCRVAPEQVLFVGDMESDIMLANTMNFDACFAKTKIAWYKDEAYIKNELRPAITVTTYSELMELLEQERLKEE